MTRVKTDPDRGRRDRSDALGRRADLDQLRRPAQHALGRDLHRARSKTRPSGGLACGFPVCRDGREIAGIGLEIRDGTVVSAGPTSGEDYLQAMLDLDPGARRLGELGLGLNSGIDRFTGSILYDEKIGGTVHLALGQSYPETGGMNQSALHWDLIVDTRTDGRITADGRVVMQDGRVAGRLAQAPLLFYNP